MVVPKNLKPRFFMSRLMASDSGEDTGISLNERMVWVIGCLSGKKDRV